jgi:hypothetical protein
VQALAAVESGAATADAVAGAAGIGFSATLVALARLERDGYVRGDRAGRWSRTALAPPDGERGRACHPVI